MLAACVLAAACFRPSIDADAIGDGPRPPSELFGPDAPPGPTCAAPDPSPLSRLRIRVRTSAIGGSFAPRNVGAIWIERSTGEFVKTVERWGKTRAKWLTRFAAASHDNLVDAVTGPTLLYHQTHEAVWDLTGLDRCEIAGGDYRVAFELTDRSGTGEATAVPFAKDQTAQTSTFPDTPYFHDLELALE